MAQYKTFGEALRGELAHRGIQAKGLSQNLGWRPNRIYEISQHGAATQAEVDALLAIKTLAALKDAPLPRIIVPRAERAAKKVSEAAAVAPKKAAKRSSKKVSAKRAGGAKKAQKAVEATAVSMMDGVIPTVDTAPRDVVLLARLNPWIHRRLGLALEHHGVEVWGSQLAETAFAVATPEQRADVLHRKLREYDVLKAEQDVALKMSELEFASHLITISRSDVSRNFLKVLLYAKHHHITVGDIHLAMQRPEWVPPKK